MVYVFFFFFQAEDGIRDGTVTGVQTCALPISAEALFDPFAHPLTDRITRMAGGARVERGTPRPRVILSHVRGDLECAARRDEAIRIVALVPSQSNAATARQPLVGHRLRR